MVIAAEKRDLDQRLHRLDLPRQRRAGDERHLNIGQKQIRLQLLYKLQRIQPISRPAHQPKPNALPVDQLAHRIEQLRLIIRHHDGQFFVHRSAPFSGSMVRVYGILQKSTRGDSQSARKLD